jgi:hypothetical protein
VNSFLLGRHCGENPAFFLEDAPNLGLNFLTDSVMG